jgi:hypothetical protein
MAAGDSYQLSEQAVKKLAKMSRWFERNSRNQHPPRNRRVVSRGGGGGWIGILQGALSYGSSASVTLYVGTAGSETAGTTVTCYPWMMSTGDSIAANTDVVGCVVNGSYYVFNSACKNIYGS